MPASPLQPASRLACLLLLGIGCLSSRLAAFELREDGYHAFPRDHLQRVLDAAAANPTNKVVQVHPGTYRPEKHRRALIHLNRRHDGIQLRGLGRPTLTAANGDVAMQSAPSFPAVVNHVIYLGDGLSTNTVIEGFRLTGANHFVLPPGRDEVEPDQTHPKGRFYFGDGGAIKIYHRSYPVLRDLEIVDNYASPCAGGVSIQHEGANRQAVLIENCIFRNNRAEVTGAALDLLWGSSARVVNCLFTGNISNTGPGEGENPFNNNGAVTVFPRSRIVVERSTFAGNRNGVDDQSGLGTYAGCIFTGNTLAGGEAGLSRFELDLQKGGTVTRCVLNGHVLDPEKAVQTTDNFLNPDGFRLDDGFVPVAAEFQAFGYRPVLSPAQPGNSSANSASRSR